MQRIHFTVFLLIAILNLNIQPVYSCSCFVHSDDQSEWFIENEYKKSFYVFIGEAVRKEYTDETEEGYDEKGNYYMNTSWPPADHKTMIKVDKSYKGNPQDEIGIMDMISNCDYQFEKGKKYLIFAFYDTEGRLRSSLCGGTRLLSEAKDSLNFIEQMVAQE